MAGRGGGLLRDLLLGLLDALGRSSKQSGEQSRGRRDPSAPVAKWRTNATPAPAPSRTAAEPSAPSRGQYGNGATRDLSRAEISGLQPSYEPKLDGEPDPGEVVWTWVPFVENDGRGKDRPVLIIARLDAGSWAGCYLSTKQHPGFVSVGTGPWDSQGRESFLSPERVLRVSDEGMRRESVGVPRAAFDRAVAAIRRHHGV